MAITEVYVDPAINANSGTGTIGDPYGDLQYALNTKTRDATNGDRFNIKSGTAEVLTAGLSLATYGTPTAAAPLVFQGYTSAAGDGGIGEIDGAGTHPIYLYGFNSNKLFLKWIDLKLGNTGTSNIVTSLYYDLFVNCEFHSCSRASDGAIYANNSRTLFINCLFNSMTAANDLRIDGIGSVVYGCRFVKSSGTNCITTLGQIIAIRNVFQIATDTALGAIVTQGNDTGSFIAENTIYSSSANTSIGISHNNSAVINNVVVGYSGTGGRGIGENQFGVFGNNAHYNNATNEVAATKWRYDLGAALALGSSPFANAAGGDFEIDGASAASGAAWPSAWKGLATTANDADIGAVQSGAGAGGGGGPVIGSRIIRGLGAI